MFNLTTHALFNDVYMASDIIMVKDNLAREKPRYHNYMGNSIRLAARAVLYAPSQS